MPGFKRWLLFVGRFQNASLRWLIYTGVLGDACRMAQCLRHCPVTASKPGF
jgi:hypothetical protein